MINGQSQPLLSFLGATILRISAGWHGINTIPARGSKARAGLDYKRLSYVFLDFSRSFAAGRVFLSSYSNFGFGSIFVTLAILMAATSWLTWRYLPKSM